MPFTNWLTLHHEDIDFPFVHGDPSFFHRTDLDKHQYLLVTRPARVHLQFCGTDVAHIFSEVWTKREPHSLHMGLQCNVNKLDIPVAFFSL